MQFFDILFEYCKSENSIFSDELKIVEKSVDDLFEGKGWDHYVSELGDVNWPIEEASWLRIVPDKQKLTHESGLFLKFLENKMGYNTSLNVLEDLIKFQVFLLSTRDDVEEIKSETFQFDWKDFFVNNTNVLKSATKKYYFKNMIIESDPIKWNCQAVFWGRRARKYKAHPERIYEDKSFSEINPLINEQNPAHSSNWDL